ncbi:MAG TPA: hypothetical protein VFB45_18215 [Pseudolabrys sp.]|nr:hypothetical protein [Pseudolabrys sp.]
MSGVVSEDDLARARQDPAFRHKLMADNLDRLLDALERMRKSNPNPNPESARQIREGVALAVKLADRLQNGGNPPPRAA